MLRKPPMACQSYRFVIFAQPVSYQKLNHVTKLLSRTVQMQHIFVVILQACNDKGYQQQIKGTYFNLLGSLLHQSWK